MTPLSRRRALRTAAIAALIGVSGCSALSRESSENEARIDGGDLWAHNFHDGPVSVSLLVLDGKNPVYWQTEEAPASEPNDPGDAHFTGLPTEPGPYRLLLRLAGQSMAEAASLDLTAVDADCVAVQAEIGSAADPADTTPAFFWGTDCGGG